MRTVSPTLLERDNLYDYRVSFRYFGTFQIVNVTYDDTKTDKNKNQLLSRHEYLDLEETVYFWLAKKEYIF